MRTLVIVLALLLAGLVAVGQVSLANCYFG